jgi:hypothetical protein
MSKSCPLSTQAIADAAKRWVDHVDHVERLIRMADARSPTSGTARRHPPNGMKAGSVESRVVDRVATLADDARVRANEVLGELEVIERRLFVD